MKATSPDPLVLFDGVCGLCNRFVDFLLRRDAARRFRFAPLQGKTAADILDRPRTSLLDTVILVLNGRMYERSDAALRCIILLGGFWKIAVIFLLIPRPLRDLVYDQIAKVRYRWFGKRDSCRIPSPEERSRFLP